MGNKIPNYAYYAEVQTFSALADSVPLLLENGSLPSIDSDGVFADKLKQDLFVRYFQICVDDIFPEYDRIHKKVTS